MRTVGRLACIIAAAASQAPTSSAPRNEVAPKAQTDAIAAEAAVVEAVWRWHQVIVVELTDTTHQVDLKRFQDAVHFFEKTTGIP
jgi:hypothetical protein